MKDFMKKTVQVFARLKSKISSFEMKQLSRYKARPCVAGLWQSEEAFLKAVRSIYQQGEIKPHSISPYPVHGLEEAMRIPRSRIPWVSLICGGSGLLFGLWFTYWASAVNWPLIVGGKPFWSLPAFVPVIFELTILFSAIGSVVALVLVCGLPHIEPPVIDKDLSCSKFALFVFEKDCPAEKAEQIFRQAGAEEIKKTVF